MKTIIKIVVIILALVGAFSTVYIAWTIRQDNKKEEAFEINCRKIKTGMTIQEAIDTMKVGLDLNYDLYQISFNKVDSTQTDYYITYPIDGGSYLVKIHFDKNTGIVTNVNRPNDEWFDKN